MPRDKTKTRKSIQLPARNVRSFQDKRIVRGKRLSIPASRMSALLLDLEHEEIVEIVRHYFKWVVDAEWVEKTRIQEVHTSHSFDIDVPDPNDSEQAVIDAVVIARRKLEYKGLL